MNNQKELVINLLRRIEAGELKGEHYEGLCSILEKNCWYKTKGYYNKEQLYSGYKYYSGDTNFPIACFSKNKIFSHESDEEKSYKIFYCCKYKNWGPGENARRRRVLAGHMADYFTEHGLI